MNNFVEELDVNMNFWEANPQIKYISPFAELYNEDKSKGKNKSSQTMWAIALYSDPVKSKLYRIPPKERKQEIEKNFIKGEFDWETDLLKAYEENLMTAAKRNYKRWGDKLTERDAYIAETEYNEDTYKMLDDMMAKTAAMWRQFEELKAILEEEEAVQKTRGNVKESAREEGLFSD